mgnify:CR=1 FL=1
MKCRNGVGNLENMIFERLNSVGKQAIQVRNRRKSNMKTVVFAAKPPKTKHAHAAIAPNFRRKQT